MPRSILSSVAKVIPRPKAKPVQVRKSRIMGLQNTRLRTLGTLKK